MKEKFKKAKSEVTNRSLKYWKSLSSFSYFVLQNSKKNFSYKFSSERIINTIKGNLNKPIIIFQKLQDLVERSVKTDHNVFLKQPKFWATSITWVLMSGTGLSIAWITLAKTDEVVIALGKLEPISGVVDVQMPLEGVTKEILVKEGDKVSKGQVLIKLDTDITKAENNALQKNIDINENILKKLKELYTEGAVSEIQFLQQQTKVNELRSQIQSNRIKLKYQEIISPQDGIVFELEPKGAGFVARSSQPVLKVVPQGELKAAVEIESRTIGFVKKGKFAEISIDSFPGSDYGVIEGVVSKIGSDALSPDPSQGKGYRFPAEITLNSQYLELESGQKLPLKAGMSLSANIKLRKVSYLQLLLNKFTDKTNSLKAI